MTWDIRSARSRILETLAVMAAYYVAGRIGLAVPFTHGNVSPLWPAAGIALGAILIFGRHVCVGIAVAAILLHLFSPVPWIARLIIAAASTLGPCVAAYLLRRQLAGPIQRLADVRYLILFGALGGAISALIGVPTLSFAGTGPAGDLLPAVATWGFGDLLGIVLIVPLFLNYADFKLTQSRLAELVILLVCLLAGSGLLFRQSAVTGSVFAFFLLPFVIWGAVRFSVAGAALASLIVSGFAVWETGRGDGPFLVHSTWLHQAQSLQVFTAVISLSGLCLAAVIAERSKAEAALAREENLRRGEEQYRRIVETTNEGVWLMDAEFKTTFVNRRLAEILGYTPEEMLGHHLLDFLFPEDHPQKHVDLERRRRGMREVLYQRCRKKDGSEVWVLVSTCPAFFEGEFSGVLAMISDVTLLRKSEEALRRNERLVTAGRLAAAISHEVNNPLEAVVNLLYLLKSEPMSEQARHYVELASREIHRVSAISKRTLGFFRDGAAWTEISLPELLDDTLSFHEHEFTTRGIAVTRDYRSRGVMRGSRSEIQQVFANLISNALDAIGSEGALTVRVYDMPDKQRPAIAIDVQDTGTGIGSDNLNRIFEPFFTTKQDTGTGLGLWVAREIIQKHGGTIAVHSQSGDGRERGTKFSIVLPAFATASAVA